MKSSSDTPKCVSDTIAALQAERGPLGARLDAIDLALDNLRRVWPVVALKAAVKPKKDRAISLVSDDSEASARRELLLTAIGKSSVGLTLGELRKQTPKMDGKARSNALQILKTLKQIRRHGNSWVKAA